jgi:hypothetical protein
MSLRDRDGSRRARRARAVHWDPVAGALWTVDERGHARGVRTADGVTVERALASSVERVVTADLVGGEVPRALLVVQQPSAGFARVLLARLDDGAVTVLARSMGATPVARASLDGRWVHVRRPGRRDVFTVWSMEDGALRGEVHARFGDGEALDERFADEGRLWRASAEGVREHPLAGEASPRWLLRFARPAESCALVRVAGSRARAAFVRDADGARVCALSEHGSVSFERAIPWGPPRAVADGDGLLVQDDHGRSWRIDARGDALLDGLPGPVLAGTDAAWLCEGDGRVAWVERAGRPSARSGAGEEPGRGVR